LNLSVNRTPGKLRLPVPSGLRPPVAGYLERYLHSPTPEEAIAKMPFLIHILIDTIHFNAER